MHKRRSMKTKFFLLLIPILTMLITLASSANSIINATSSITNTLDPIDITITRNPASATPTTKTTTTTTTVTTDSPTGYTLSARLYQVLSVGITAKLNQENLSTSDVAIWDDAASSSREHTLAVTVSADVPTGNYSFDIIYTATDSAIIALAEVVEGNNITTMQGLTDAFCQSADYDPTDNGVNGNNTVTLTDIRNGQNYMVRKLADNNCWMITNLKLGSTTGTTLLTPADTNIMSNWTLPQVNAGGAPSTTDYYDQPIIDAKVDVAGSGSLQTDITASDFYGYYYNWCAATAGGIASGGSDTCTDSVTLPDDATNDICPANWRLPTGDISGEFAILNASMNANALAPADTTNYYSNWLFTGPFRGVFAGTRFSSSWLNTGVNGYFWSSSSVASGANFAFILVYNSSTSAVYPGATNGVRGYRNNIRCLVD
jgi:uncharacterized protein (TIGR02145 family)